MSKIPKPATTPVVYVKAIQLPAKVPAGTTSVHAGQVINQMPIVIPPKPKGG